jgi:hypothetical protein
MIEMEEGFIRHATPGVSWQQWLDEVAEWKSGLTTTRMASAADLVIEDRRARR